MINKKGKLIAADNSGAAIIKCIHDYNRQSNQLGNFLKCVLCQFDPKKKLLKKKKYLCLVITTKKKQQRRNGSFINFSENRAVLMADPLKLIGSRIHGPMAREVKNKFPEQQFKKFKSLAAIVI